MSEAPGTREDLVAFLDTVAKVGCEVEGVDDHTNLVDEGIIDSLALVEVVAWLEENHGVDFRAHGIDPSDLASIEGILSAIRRAGE